MPLPRPRPDGYPIGGVDTALYQHAGGQAINWTQVRASGVEIATVKATRGLDITDPWFTRDFAGALQAGLRSPPTTSTPL